MSKAETEAQSSHRREGWIQSASVVCTLDSAEKLEYMGSQEPEGESCQEGLSARVNAVERLKVESEWGMGGGRGGREIRPAMLGDLQEKSFHRQIEARAKVKVTENVEETYSNSLLVLK